MVNRAEIIKKAKIVLGNDADEEKIGVCIDTAESVIKGYCSIDEIIPDVEVILGDMVLDIYKEGFDECGNLKGIKEGDVDITIGEGTGERSGLFYLLNYESRLKPFRRVKW